MEKLYRLVSEKIIIKISERPITQDGGDLGDLLLEALSFKIMSLFVF